MRRAGLSPEVRRGSSRQLHPRDPHHPHPRDPRHPRAAGSRWLSPPNPPERCWAPPAPARRVVFADEVMPPGRPPGRRSPPAAARGGGSVPPSLSPQPRAVPDYVVRYPAIRSPRQREGYKGVFQDQLGEYTELLQELRAAWQRLRGTEVTMGRWPPPHPTGRRAEPPGVRDGSHSAPQDGDRVTHAWHQHGRKTKDWALLGKQQRCQYLQQKLTHIKARIQEFERGDSGCS
ncbi:occludin/ELL domain-containing protein 1 isoform X2 [Calypte anna]|uniref:occludin/ELL domain-containing protein 1 isoform X2 n=1 Tax=Calypte anna TaxID=9244 RepID=UPI0011C3EFFE|nr:occludin/ELL domain-containing protein 1 isoform X2 [Calypte anna]